MKLFPLFLAVCTSQAAIVGVEDFTYPDGPVGGSRKGYGFDFDNTTEDGDPSSHNGTRSFWLPLQGIPSIENNQLQTDNQSVQRRYNGPSLGSLPGGLASPEERTGVIFDEPLREEQVVYYLVQLTPLEPSASYQVTSYDFETPTISYGIPEGEATLGILHRNQGQTLSATTPPAGEAMTLVAKMDFPNDRLELWLNPDLTLPETDLANSPVVRQENILDQFSSGVGLSSQGLVSWERLIVATTWDDLQLPDQDGDGLPDWWELALGTQVEVLDDGEDPDSDGLDNWAEYLTGTSPQLADSDEDGLGDHEELFTYHTDPELADSDNDGLTDGMEVETMRSDPLVADSDADGFSDKEEYLLGTDPAKQEDSPADFANLSAEPAMGLTQENISTLLAEEELTSLLLGSPLDDSLDLSLSLTFSMQWPQLSSDEGYSGWGGLRLMKDGAPLITIGNRWGSTNWSYFNDTQIEDITKPDFTPLTLVAGEPQTFKVLIHLQAGKDDELEIFFQGQRVFLSGDFAFQDIEAISSWGQTLDFLSLSLIAEKPVAHADNLTIRLGDTARFLPLENDTGSPSPASLQIQSPPRLGTAIPQADGSIVYQHTSSSTGTDLFTYQVSRGLNITTGAINIRIQDSPRISADFHTFPPAPPGTSYSLIDAFPGITFDSPHCLSANDERDPLKLFVGEASGRIYLIPNVIDPSKELLLDISDRVLNDDNERALKGLAPHPNFNSNGYLYVAYHHCPHGLNCGEYLGDAGTGSDTVRLSRFTCLTEPPYTADPDSEFILLEQENEGFIHGIDSCRFARDGYLYVAFGDEGSQEEEFANSQRIDKDFYSSIIRIDVDNKPENLSPNPHPAIITDEGVARYSIPADNPFVGATSFNGQEVLPEEVRTEFFCVGLRNPWQFFPLDRDDDKTTDEVWLGDVGRFDREEITVLTPGGNGEWGWQEGSIPGPLSGQTINGAQQNDAQLTAPIWDYPHVDTPYGGNSVTGGVFYRGANYGTIRDTYIFADYVSGNIWSLDDSNPADITVDRIAGESGIVCITVNPSTNDLLFLDREDGMIHKLVLSADETLLPQTLSETNFFADLTSLTPNPGGVPYEVNLRFWSDYADKKRWFLHNEPDANFDFYREGRWYFPSGTIWVKHFDIELTRGDPATSRKLETRFLIKTADSAYGLTYRWNNITSEEPQTDATLVPEQGESLQLPIIEEGLARVQDWTFPSRSSCLSCHNQPAGTILSFNTSQLNHEGTLHGESGNFLQLMDQFGYLHNFEDGNLPRYVRPDEVAYSLTERARSYLAVNCSYCHFLGGPAGGSWDGRNHLTLDQTRLVNQYPLTTLLSNDHRLIVPGDHDKSVIYNRAAEANGYTRMPPLATSEIDLEGMQLLIDWIDREVPAVTNYQQFRDAHFANQPYDEGEPAADPDRDGHTNQYEYLTRTDPNDPTSSWTPSLSLSGENVSLTYQPLPDRVITPYSSRDLQTWQKESHEDLPLNPESPVFLVAPLTEKEFFRFTVEER